MPTRLVNNFAALAILLFFTVSAVPAQTPNTSHETPILGRKVSNLPLLNSAFRQGKGTGHLFVNQIYFITGVGSRRCHNFSARRRQAMMKAGAGRPPSQRQ